MRNELSAVSANCGTLLDDETLTETATSSLEQERRALIDWRVKVLRREADLNAYKKLNGITEEADYPANKVAPFAWLVPMVAIETALNTVFYENANGLLGGAVVALGVSTLNIGFAFLTGCLFRYKNLQRPANKAIGYLSLVAAALIAIYCNALFAAFRSEYSLLEDPSDLKQGSEAFMTASAAAAKVFFLELPATDLQSFVLFFVGLGLSILAFWKGMHVDDKHPGYGRKARLLKEAHDAYDDIVERVTAKVKGELEQKRAGIAHAKTYIEKAQANLQQIKTALDVEYRKMQSTLTQVQRDFALVLNAYRQSNVSVRTVSPPVYFAETPNLIESYAAEPDNNLTSVISDMEEEISVLKDAYVVRLTEKLRDITNEGRHILGKTVTAFLDEVDVHAKRRIDEETHTVPKPSLA
ncbi:hypothetical protein D2917_07860 [Cupriavidus oxalaticus]|uniref:Transmembrane protein n=2 Tax=Cupriavidus oxalaticus TaxID=96344 RepID=A0A5P3VFI3_9BURK|nr:hypothetical protein D2917_07860 [Cupriavidus oxalaticus]